MSSENSSSSTGIGVLGLLGLLGVCFVVLNLIGIINWSWWFVTMPFWGGLALLLVILIVFGIGYCIYMLFNIMKKQKEIKEESII